MQTVTISPKFQVVIPKSIREQLHLVADVQRFSAPVRGRQRVDVLWRFLAANQGHCSRERQETKHGEGSKTEHEMDLLVPVAGRDGAR